MRFLVFLLLLASQTALAQLRLYAVDAAGAEREATGLFDLGSGAPGDQVQARFRVRNTGTAGVSLQQYGVSGQGFTVTGPLTPLNIAPGLFETLTVRFTGTGSGSYSANLTVNALSLLLRATVVAAPVLTSGAGADVPAGTAIFLGRVQKGQRGSVALALENRGRDPLTVRTITVSGSAFTYRGGAPLTVAAGVPQRFEIEFAPAVSGNYTGTLNIDGRTFPLTGVGFDPPIPKPALMIEGNTASGQQPKLMIELASAPETAGSGTLRMDFRPSGTLPDDAAIRFVTGGGRSIQVQVREGERRAFFGGGSTTLREAAFQTGTTAGVLTMTLELGTHVETQTISLQPAAPAMDVPTALRKTQELEIALTGFDNTRSLSQALFTFYDGSGRPISPGTIRADVRRDFEEFFRSPGGTTAGGTFSLRAVFPVSGGAATQVSGVEVELVNSAGAGRTQRISFQ